MTEPLTNVNFVAAAYLVIWVALVGYVWYIHRFTKESREELERLEEKVNRLLNSGE